MAGSVSGTDTPKAIRLERPQGGPLAACLLQVARFHGRPASQETILAGLPLENGRSPLPFSPGRLPVPALPPVLPRFPSKS